MLILRGQILAEYANHAYETTRLRRNGVQTNRDLVSATMLAELEAIGDAMRYLNSDGQIAWKATPKLRDYLKPKVTSGAPRSFTMLNDASEGKAIILFRLNLAKSVLLAHHQNSTLKQRISRDYS